MSQQLGSTVEEIRTELPPLPASRTPTRKDRERISRNFRARLDERINCMTRLREYLDGCIGRGCLSKKKCALVNPKDGLKKKYGVGAGAVLRDRFAEQPLAIRCCSVQIVRRFRGDLGSFTMSSTGTQPTRSTNWPMKLVSLTLATAGLAAVGTCIHGFVSGWLTPHWQQVTEAQAALIAAICTVYAAVFASVVAPTLFGGQLRQLGRASEAAINELKTSFAEIAAEQRRSGQEMLDIAEQSKASLVVLQNYALHMMGFVEKFSEADLPNAKNIIQNFQQTVAILCQEALSNSSKWAVTKNRFNGKWPGRAPYINLLLEVGIIAQEQRDKLLMIADSAKYTRDQNAEPISLVQLNLLNKTMRELKASFSEGA